MCSPSGSVSCHVDATFSRRAARVSADLKHGERCVWMFSDVVLVVWLCASSGLCVWRDSRMCSPSGLMSCHVDATFSRRAARVGLDVKDGERCVCCSRMWCWLFGCVHRLGSVCGAIRTCQFDWIRVMSRRHGVLVESGADLRRSKDGEMWCVCCSRMWCWLFDFVNSLDCVWCASRWPVSSTGLATCHVDTSFSWGAAHG